MQAKHAVTVHYPDGETMRERDFAKGDDLSKLPATVQRVLVRQGHATSTKDERAELVAAPAEGAAPAPATKAAAKKVARKRSR